MEKSDKRRCKHMSPQTNSMIAKYGNYGDNRTECWRKYRQDRDLPICHERSERRQSNPPFDTTTDYHCSDSYKQRKHHGLPGASRTNKYLIPPVSEENYRIDSKNHGILRALRSQFYPNNIAIVSKTRYKDEDDVDEDSKYVLESTVDDNLEKEMGEDVDEEHENAFEYSDKDYEEQEADDEVDEESDVVERQMERLRTQRKSRIAPLQRGQRTSVVSESSYNRRGQKISMGKDSERCCHTATERDNADVPTEDDDEDQDVCDSALYPLKKSTWRYRVMHQDRECRHQPGNYDERYSDLNRMSSEQTRRPRTTKPNIESSMTSTRLPQASIRNNRCSQCGVSKGQTTKTTASRNAGCRLEGNRYFTKVPIGDEVVGFEDPEPIISYQTKTRKSKESRSPCYDQHEASKKMDAELGAIYKTCRSKNPRELSNGFSERTKQSLRSSNRHDPTASLKNDNHYWR